MLVFFETNHKTSLCENVLHCCMLKAYVLQFIFFYFPCFLSLRSYEFISTCTYNSFISSPECLEKIKRLTKFIRNRKFYCSSLLLFTTWLLMLGKTGQIRSRSTTFCTQHKLIRHVMGP